MKAWYWILIIWMTGATPCLALEAMPWSDAGEEPPPRPWIHAMEASMQPLGHGEAAPIPWSSWAGWTLAVLFFLYLLNLHLKMKRREQFLLRGGERDFFLLPPARNRRDRPR